MHVVEAAQSDKDAEDAFWKGCGNEADARG